MSIQVNYALKINELHNRLSVQLKTTVQIAIEIGKLLLEVKEHCPHGTFLNWIDSNCDFDDNTAYRYIKCHKYFDKIPNVGNLQEAYNKIKEIETKEKQEEWKRKDRLIKERMNTGKKPEN